MRNGWMIFLLIGHVMFAGKLTAQGSAGQAGEFLRFGVGAKALGLGRAFTSVADDASAPYWNPAGLSALSRSGGAFMFMYLPLKQGASFNYLAGGIPLRLFFVKSNTHNPFLNFVQDLNIGVGFLWHSLGDFQFYDDSGRQSEASQTAISQSALYVSVSYPLHQLLKGKKFLSWGKFLRGNFDLGLTSKFVRSNLFGEGGGATSFDLGFKYSHHSGAVNLGLTIRDLNQASISYGSGVAADKIPVNGALGISVRPPFGRLRGLLLAFDYGVIAPGRRSHDRMFGLEYDLSVLRADLPIKLRLGANSNHEAITFGVNFSPETLLERDWLPSADWTYANDRSAFDATGARFSFSVDHNPFTARYWYFRAMAGGSNFEQLANREQTLRYLQNAQQAKNPGGRAYRYEAALRLADVEFVSAIAELLNSSQQSSLDNKNSAKHFERIGELFTKRAHPLLQADFGKSAVDSAAYCRSFAYFVQSLILAANYDDAIQACADSGQSWGKRINVFYERPGNHTTETAPHVHYLQAFALYMNHFQQDAINIAAEKLSGFSLAQYLRGHILFLQGDYLGAAAELEAIDLNDSHFPPDLFLPLASDRRFGDEILFLKAAALYKISPHAAGQYIAEFAKIPRFFPDSDMAKFLTNGPSLLASLMTHFDKGEIEQAAALVEKIIESYLKAFSSGTLKEESYTFNFR